MNETISRAMELTSVVTTEPRPVVTRIISDAGFDALKPVWDSLLAKSDINTIFLTHTWLRSWWTAFGSGNELCILAIKKNNDIIGIAPLMVKNSRRIGLRSRTVQFIGTPDADYGDLIGADKALLWSLCIDYLMANDNYWDKISLEQVTEDSSSLNALRELLGKTGEVFQIVESDLCLRFRYHGDESKRQEFALRRSHDLKRCYNYFKGAGGFELKRVETAEAVERELRMLFLLHQTRWEGTATPSKFSEESLRVFFTDLAAHLRPSGSLCLMTSYCGGIPITLSFNYEYNKIIYHYTLAYNQYFAKKSPGTLHVLHQTEVFVKEGFDLDFARGAGPYKKLVADEEYRNYRITVFGRTWEKQLLDGYDRLKRTNWGQKLIQSKKAQEVKTRAITAIQAHGLLGALGQSIAGVFRYVMSISKKETYLFSTPAASIPAQSHETVRELTSLEHGILATYYGILLDSPEEKEIIARFQKGMRCFGIFEYDILSASVWLTDANKPHLTNLRITPNCTSAKTAAHLIGHVLHNAPSGAPISLTESSVSHEMLQEFSNCGLTISKQSSLSVSVFNRKIL